MPEPDRIYVPVIDSAEWTGRFPPPPKEPPPPRIPTFQEELARIAVEHGTDFASRVAASYNRIHGP